MKKLTGIQLYQQTLTLHYINGHIIQTENWSVIYLKTFLNFLFITDTRRNVNNLK